MLEERDARIAVLEAALEPFAKMNLSNEWGGDSLLARDDYETLKVKHFRRAAAAYPTHSEGGEADTTGHVERSRPDIAQPLSDEGSAAALRSQAEANVLAVRSWDAPGFEACVTAEIEKMKSAPVISPMQVQHANEAWNAQPPDASEEDRMKAALETLGASPSAPDEASAAEPPQEDREDTNIGGVTWHSSGPDEGPDVGISVYLGNEHRLWCGEISKSLFDDCDGAEHFDNDMGTFIVWYAPEHRLIAKCGDKYEAREFVEAIAAQLRAASPSPSALTEAWRTMDSAPKDGSLFIAYNSHMDTMAVVGWTADHDLADGGTWTDAGGRNCGNALSFSVHYFDWWRPRPDTSAIAKEGE